MVDVLKHTLQDTFYCDTITRKVVSQIWRGNISPWDQSYPAGLGTNPEYFNLRYN